MKNFWEKIKEFFKKQAEKIEDFFVGLWNELIEWIKNPWEKFKGWLKKTVLPWFKKSWMQIVNMIILFIAYDKLFSFEPAPQFATAFTGLWLFLLLGYYIFWKLLGLEKIYQKKREDRLKNEG